MLKKITLMIVLSLVLSGCIESLDEFGNVITPTPPPLEVSEDLQIEDIVAGEGAEAKAGDTLRVDYTGTLEDGTQFDSSKDEGREPFEFILGGGGVIAGWEQGVQGMKVGGTRKLTVPPELGYGDAGSGEIIPPGATLIFEIELLEII